MADPFSAAVSLLDEAADAGVFSGAVLRVDRLDGPVLVEAALGTVSAEPPGAPVTAQSRFDLASLTKLITTTVALRLVDRGTLSLDARVADLLGARWPHASDATVRHLLDHTSGLPAWKDLWRTGPVVDGALALAPEASAGERHVYSDVGFLVLGVVLETVGGRSLRQLARDEVLGPLGMDHTRYRPRPAPPPSLDSSAIVATEHTADRGFLHGEVSDGNSWHLGGVAPQAGLFGPAEDLAAFARGWWTAPETGYLSRALRDAAWGEPSHPGGHVLGWDTVPPDGYTSVGRVLSPRSRGHLGFTGTSLWIDPDRRISVVLLTNRVHPSREEARHKPLRPAVHDAVARAVDALP